MNETLTKEVPKNGREASEQGYLCRANPFDEVTEHAAWMTWKKEYIEAFEKALERERAE